MSNIGFCLIAILFLLNIQIQPQTSWEKIKTPVSVSLYKVVYLDSLHLWAAGDSGTIVFSSDRGTSWHIQNNGLENGIQDIFFIDNYIGWAVTWFLDGINLQSHILFTSDGGVNWEAQRYRNSDVILRTIYFLDSLNGWVGGDPFELAYTKDGGVNWLPANFDTSAQAYFPIHQIKFSTSQYGFAVGGAVDFAGVVWSSNNGGESWKGYLVAPDIFDNFIFLDSINILSLSADLEGIYPIGILKFNIIQNFWDYSEINNYGSVTGLAKRTSQEFWGTIGNSNNFIISTDAGEIWTLIPSPDSLFVYDVAFTDSLNGFAVGENGFVFKYIPSPPSSIKNEGDLSHAHEIILYQNYPNPFNPSTIISWQSSVSSQQVIKVFDVLGNEVITLLDEYKPAGFHEIEFSAKDQLPSGIYFYQLKIGKSIQTKKMLLLR